jgi:hypothetical protein
MERDMSSFASFYCIPSVQYSDQCYELFSKIGSDERSELWLARRIKRASVYPKNPLGKREAPSNLERNPEHFHVKKYVFSN